MIGDDDRSGGRRRADQAGGRGSRRQGARRARDHRHHRGRRAGGRAPGDLVSVHYVGALHSDGSEFDAPWDRGEPFAFQLGAGKVIPGWDEGVAGMRVGGRRQLVIPPDKAYGRQGSGPIGPNETLVFVVDLLDVSS
ncbi:MAG TPA: FKBP-type peptidyl-prolyl cis-trans isomerase [Solirubrobacterales bacterium]|nr:FKBP-type peptidyl-prolyl cis-trans isomerase [Solirubrobacterales bacterium]